ncbi:MAG: hypothetical protein KF789_13870 [Bdellovibrionaceae bacterium]|nr:hypothetical protein [Pseudobdellovibrionaceae bacterium]
MSMRLDVYPVENWDRTNTALEEAWGKHEGNLIQAHRGLATALHEIVLGFAQIYSHKRAIAVVKGNSWAVDFVVPWFLKEAYTVQSIQLEELEKDPEAWVKSLKKDTAFVLFVEDHPVTGETWDWDRFDHLLNDNKQFSIRVSHHSFVSRREASRPLSCRVSSISEHLAVSSSGNRFRISSEIAPWGDWQIDVETERLNKRLSEAVDEKAVLAFEALFPGKALLNGKKRHYDRALLSFEDVGADALIALLEQKLGSSEGLQALHLCAWQSVRLYKGWWKNPPSPDALRGALAIALPLLQRKDFAKLLQESYEELRSRQSW